MKIEIDEETRRRLQLTYSIDFELGKDNWIITQIQKFPSKRKVVIIMEVKGTDSKETNL